MTRAESMTFWESLPMPTIRALILLKDPPIDAEIQRKWKILQRYWLVRMEMGSATLTPKCGNCGRMPSDHAAGAKCVYAAGRFDVGDGA